MFLEITVTTTSSTHLALRIFLDKSKLSDHLSLLSWAHNHTYRRWIWCYAYCHIRTSKPHPTQRREKTHFIFISMGYLNFLSSQRDMLIITQTINRISIVSLTREKFNKNTMNNRNFGRGFVTYYIFPGRAHKNTIFLWLISMVGYRQWIRRTTAANSVCIVHCMPRATKIPLPTNYLAVICYFSTGIEQRQRRQCHRDGRFMIFTIFNGFSDRILPIDLAFNMYYGIWTKKIGTWINCYFIDGCTS